MPSLTRPCGKPSLGALCVAAVFNVFSFAVEIGRVACGRRLAFLGRSRVVPSALGSQRVKRLSGPAARPLLRLVSA